MQFYGEISADGEGRRVEGTAVRYGDRTGPRSAGRHVIEAGALTIAKEALATLNHRDDRLLGKLGEGLAFEDSAKQLRTTIDMPEGVSYAEDALQLIRQRRLNGLSLEIEPRKTRQDGELYVIEDGLVHAVSVVPKPAFGMSRIDRFQALGSVAGKIPTGVKLGCECSGSAECHYAYFQEDAFSSLDQVIGKTAEEVRDLIDAGDVQDVLAVASNQSEPLGSLASGSLQFTKEGAAIGWSLQVPDTHVGRGVLEGMGAVSYFGRPYLSQSESEGTETDGVYTWTRAVIRMLIVSPTDRSEGWDAISLTRERNAAMKPEEVLAWA
ncbi:MAG: hypothetical protein F4Z29_05555 [Gemmatimonadetes bacterium]|nr:hypothetical protein [Gemmatimonadota bacterium]